MKNLNKISLFILLLFASNIFAITDEQSKEAAYIEINQKKIKAILKDADSAKFRNTFVSRKLGMPIVCGEVNAKNSFGAYIGFERFVSGGTIQVVESDMKNGEMDDLWMQACK